jgi:hypothetical protein
MLVWLCGGGNRASLARRKESLMADDLFEVEVQETTVAVLEHLHSFVDASYGDDSAL